MQFLHKGVLALLEPVSDDDDDESYALAALLNGPPLASSGPFARISFGGDEREDMRYEAFGAQFVGSIAFPPGVLSQLVRSGALSVANGTTARKILAVPLEARWAAAGGAVAASEAEEAALGDAQRRLWFKRHHEHFAGLDDVDFDLEDIEDVDLEDFLDDFEDIEGMDWGDE